MRTLILLFLTWLVSGLTGAAVAAPPAREWTVMVYVNGKNDLETFALTDVNEM